MEAYYIMSMGSNLGPVITVSFVRNLKLSSYNINIMNFNAQSIVSGSSSNKLDKIRTIFADDIFDVIGVSESWLKDYVTDNAVNIHGYHLFRMDRTLALMLKNI